VPYLLVTSGYLPAIDDPRYDLAHWDHANAPSQATG